MELNVLVHPFTYHKFVTDKSKNHFDEFIDDNNFKLILYSPVPEKSKDLFFQMTNYSFKELKKKGDVLLIPTYCFIGEVVNEYKKVVNELVKDYNTITFAGQTTNLSVNGFCLDGIIKDFDKEADKSARFNLIGELLGTMEGVCSGFSNNFNISLNYNTDRKIIVKGL